ncbi:MAG TPA: YrzE family protein [Ilumatobacteraceae bacterium]|nr:YrzE family protein [Ilumatobacteraceae bacterium]
MQPATPTTTTTTVRTAEAYRKPHPIRGILWGLLMGIGAAVIAILLKVIPFDLVWALIVLGAGILLGILWSTLGPAKKPKGDPPWRPTEQVTQRPDWDAGPVPPSPSTPPGVEPLTIRPLDVEPLDIDSPARAEVATSDVPVVDVPAETPPDVAEPFDAPVAEPPSTNDPPPRSDPPPPPPPPPLRD